MSAVALVAAKGSPGVTTLATALVLAHARGGAVLVEADAHGGDLALLHGVPQSPGLTELAARARRAATGGDLLDPFVTPLAEGALPTVLAPVDGAAVRAALNVLADHPSLLNTGDRRLVFDLGRVEPESPGWMWLSACERVLLVSRTNLTSLAHAATLTQQLRESEIPAALALIESGPYPPAEAQEALALPLAGLLPFHPKQARALLDPAAIHRVASGRLATRAGHLVDILTRQPVGVPV